MDDIFQKAEQTIIAELSETGNFVSNELKVMGKKIDSLKNSNTERDLTFIRKMEDLIKQLQQTAIDEMVDIRDFFLGEMKALKEKVESLKDGKAETVEGVYYTKEVDDFLKKFQQSIIERISRMRSLVLGELKVINEKIESLEFGKTETNLGMDFFDLYAQESLLREGSMGRVYKVRDLETGKVCAMKCIGLEENVLNAELFRELSRLNDMEHSIVKLQKACPCEGSVYLILEYVGDDLSGFMGGHIDAEIAEIFSPTMEEPVKEKTRIVVSSRSLKAMHEVTAKFIRVAKGMCLRVWGPCRVPAQVIDIKTRSAPCPKGSRPYGNFKLRLYETTVDVLCSTEVVREIISGCNVGDVEIEIVVV